MKISFSIGGEVNNSFNNSITSAISGLSKIQKKENELKDKQILIGKAKAESSALGKLNKELKLQEAKLSDLMAKKVQAGGASNELTLKEQAMREAIKETNAKLKDQKAITDSAFSRVKKAGIDTKDLSAEEKRLKEQLTKTNADFEKRNKLVKSVQTGYRKSITALKWMTGVTIGASAGIAKFTTSMSAKGDAIAKTADKLGISTEALQKLHYAGERTGVSTEAMNMSLQRMTRRVSEAAKGTGAAKDALDELGLSAVELNELSPDKAFELIADSLDKVTNKQDKLRLAQKLFDSGGVGLVNTIKGGSKALRELGDEAQKTGFVLSEKSLRAAEDNQDAYLNLKASFVGVTNTLSNALMPVVTDSFKKLSTWISSNHETVKGWGNNLATIFKMAASWVSFFFGDSMLSKITRWTTLLGGGGFVAINILSKLTSAFKVGFAVTKTFALGIRIVSMALISNPIGALIAVATAAIVGIGYAIWHFRDEIIGAFSSAWDGLKNAWNNFTSWFGNIGDYASQALGTLKDAFFGRLNSIKNIFTNVINWVKSKFEWFNKTTNYLSEKWAKFKSWFGLGDKDKKEIKIDETQTQKVMGINEFANDVRATRAANNINNNKKNEVTLHNNITIQGNADPKEMTDAIYKATMPLYSNQYLMG